MLLQKVLSFANVTHTRIDRVATESRPAVLFMLHGSDAGGLCLCTRVHGAPGIDAVNEVAEHHDQVLEASV